MFDLSEERKRVAAMLASGVCVCIYGRTMDGWLAGWMDGWMDLCTRVQAGREGEMLCE